MQSTQTIPLSIIIATIKPGPDIRNCLISLYNQAQAVDAEVIIADGSTQGQPDDLARSYPKVNWLNKPGASVFYLRGLAMTQARGEIIAVTEDHCQVTLGWCERIIQAHKDYPDAAAIGGAVENGPGEHLIDWANFFLIFAPFMLPIQNGESARICLQANISYKRRVLPQGVSKLGMMEMLFNQRLRQQREKLVNDDKLIVYHVQSHGFLGTLAAHFHNGRSIAGFRLQYIRWSERIVRLGRSFVLPLYLLWHTLQAILKKHRLLGQALACLPWLVLIVCCHAAGELIGYSVGPGNSPQRLP